MGKGWQGVIDPFHPMPSGMGFAQSGESLTGLGRFHAMARVETC